MQKEVVMKRMMQEWDKWMCWWNREEVKNFFGSEKGPMGVLLEYYGYTQAEKADGYNSENFMSFVLTGGAENADAKQHFKGVRGVQKNFEELFTHYEKFNYLGLILKAERANKKEALLYFLQSDSKDQVNIAEYAKWTLVGASHFAIVSLGGLQEGLKSKEECALEVYKAMASKTVYRDHNDDALRQLLRLNVDLNNQLGRKFDFSLYGEKSLVHIAPESSEQAENSRLCSDDTHKAGHGVHCIGNLVLLDKSKSSSFSDDSFEDKKKKYFNFGNAGWSLKLPHSINIFSKKEWDEQSIIENQKEFLDEYRACYGL